jgi:NADH-quinone oxidoreductase subunit A
MAQDYIPVIFQIILALLVAGGLVFLSHILGPKKRTKVKNDTYECGVDYWGDARKHFNIKYYLIAILFILFDIEIVFLFPWAVVYKKIGIIGIVEMFIFLFILIVGLVYAWKKGALEWE